MLDFFYFISFLLQEEDQLHNGNQCKILMYPGIHMHGYLFAGSKLHLSSCRHEQPCASYGRIACYSFCRISILLHSSEHQDSYHVESYKNLRSIMMKSILIRCLPCCTGQSR